MLTTPFVTGSPIWVDLATPDLDGARTFYHGLFGWEFSSAGPDTGGYGMFQMDGRTAAAAMPLSPDQGPPAWTLYFRTPDADAAAEAVEQGGGSVRFRPMDVMDMGRMAVFADPAGADFAVWQPGRNEGLDIVNQPSSLCWGELYTPDENAAEAFYRSVFGWESMSVPMPDGKGTYRMVNPAGQGSDAMFAGVVPTGPGSSEQTPQWLLYFAVLDCDASVALAGELGATVRTPATDIEGVGRFAKLDDPYGACFAIMQAAGPGA